MSHAAAKEDEWFLSFFPEDFKGHAVEVGAYDGLSTSNTLLLEQNGWTVLCIEPNPDLAQSLRVNRKNCMECACSDVSGEQSFHVYLPAPGSFSSLKPKLGHSVYAPKPEAKWSVVKVQVRTLTECLLLAEFPGLDALSIDTEGTDLDVLKGLDFARWRPKVVVVESWDPDPEMDGFLAQNGYTLAERREVNNLYLSDV